MTITDAHADFLSDAYAGMSAAMYSSAGSLREYWEHSLQGRDNQLPHASIVRDVGFLE